MKKNILFTCVFLTFLQSKLFAQKIDTITSFDYDTSLHSFINSSQQVFTYNGACYVTKYNYVLWDSTKSKYVNYYRTTNSLLANNATSQTLSQLWNDATSKWDNYQKGIYTYTTSPTMPSTILYQNYNGNSWINSRLYTYSYDASWNDTSILIQDWNVANSSWKNVYLYKYLYNNNTVTQFSQYVWDNASVNWKNDYRINYVLNTAGKIILDSGIKWNSATTSWINNYKSLYSYDANNFLVEYTYNVWDTLAIQYKPYQKYTYVNNPFGLAIDMFTLNYNGTGFDTLYLDHNNYNSCILPIEEIRVMAEKNVITNLNIIKWTATNITNAKKFVVEVSYDANKFSEEKFFDANTSSNIYTHTSDKDVVYYRIKEVFNDGRSLYSKVVKLSSITTKQNISIYPNPAHSTLIVRPHSSFKNGFVTIYNTNGIALKTQSLNSSGNVLNISDLAKGFYIIKIHNQFGEYISRLIID